MSIALSLGYAMVRSNAAAVSVGGNHQLRAEARNAALSGLMIARRQIHQSSWGGVDSVLSGSLGSNVTYHVTFEVGDSQLSPSHPDYAEFPYRLTIISQGTATDPANPTRTSSSESRAVVQLVRRAVVAPPSSWTATGNHTLYQWDNADVQFAIPARATNSLYCEGSVRLAEDIPELAGGALNGRLDEVAFFDRGVGELEVLDIYESSLGLSPTYTDIEDAYQNLKPVHWWRFNESAGQGTAVDSGLNTWDGAYQGPTLGVAGPALANQPSNTALHLDGVNDHIELGARDFKKYTASTGTESALKTFSVLAWVRLDQLASVEVPILTKAAGASATDHYLTFSLVPAGVTNRMNLHLKTLTGDNTVTALAGDVLPGTWHFVAVTYSGNQARFFLDGVRVSKLDVLQSGDPQPHPDIPVQIGASPLIRKRYLRDLEQRRVATGEDDRPFNGPVNFDATRTDDAVATYLDTDLALSTAAIVAGDTAPVSAPGAITTYRLYAGGPAYTIPTLASTASSLTLAPDPEQNPLGVFLSTGSTAWDANCSVQGIILGDSSSTLTLNGPGVEISGVDLPALDSGEVHQLPVLISGGRLEIEPGSAVQIKGCSLSADRFEVRSGSQSDGLTLTGQLLARDVRIGGRDEWQQTQDWWAQRLSSFLHQVSSASPISYFPEYLESAEGLDPTPKIFIQRPDPVRSYHWHDWSQPIFQPHPDDSGLRWKLIWMTRMN